MSHLKNQSTIRTSRTSIITALVPPGGELSFRTRVFIGARVRSHCVRMASRAPSHCPGPCRRYWYGVHGPKKTFKKRPKSDLKSFPVKINNFIYIKLITDLPDLSFLRKKNVANRHTTPPQIFGSPLKTVAQRST